MIYKRRLKTLKIITIGTLKGGVGKSVVSYNLAGLLGENKKVLLIDVDPQTNLSLDVGIDVTSKHLKTVKNIFEENIGAEDVIFKSPIDALPNIDIIPSSITLTATELKIVSSAGREQILKNFISDNKNVLKKYDYIIIDTSPSMGIVNQNAFLIADSIILISDISLNAIQGAELFIVLWEESRRQLRKKDNVKALIINNYVKRLKLSSQLIEYCKENDSIKNLLLDTTITNSKKVKDTELEHKPINVLYKNSNTHEEYKNILLELEERGVL